MEDHLSRNSNGQSFKLTDDNLRVQLRTVAALVTRLINLFLPWVPEDIFVLSILNKAESAERKK